MSKEESGKAAEGVRAVDRALSILLAFHADDEDLSAVQLAQRTQLSRPTFYRLVSSLENHGFVRTYGEPQRYKLGPAIAKLAHVWGSTLQVVETARPILREVWEKTAETVALFVPQGDQRLCVAELPSPQPLSFKRGVGYSESIVLGASGRAIVAFSNTTGEQLKVYGMAAAEVEPFLTELQRVRQRGYAFSRNELIQGAVAVATPFYNYDGTVAGSIGAYGPEVRTGEARVKELAGLLRVASDKLSRELGYTAEERLRPAGA